MGRRSLVVAGVAAALLWAGSAAATPTTQQVTITASDGTALACGLMLPGGTPPAGGWPGIILFHGLGGSYADMLSIAGLTVVPAGFAALACDARGTGASGGSFGLDGPREDQDAQDLYTWFTARPDISDTQIGALGISLGGGAVWNATAAGVPFKAIVPAVTWTDLNAALAPQNVAKSGILAPIARAVPESRWDPSLAAERNALLGGRVGPAVLAVGAARSVRATLPTITTPTLLLQGMHDFLFDIDQAETAYRLLAGPKRLYLGDLGHMPAANPPAERPVYLGQVVRWFLRYLDGEKTGIDTEKPVELAHDPWDGTTASYPGLPPTRTASVALPGASTLGPAAHVTRAARLTGGPHETFGDGKVIVRYSGARRWPHLVATVSVAGSPVPITLGAAPVRKAAGVLTIKLLNEAVTIPRGKRLTVTLGASSGKNGVYTGNAPAGASITVGRVTLELSLLKTPAR